jgi:hypothetical protein
LGPAGDGGYVVNQRAVYRSHHLLSFGINADWDFELDFLKNNPDVTLACFDYSVSKRVFLKKTLYAVNDALSLKSAGQLLTLKFAVVGQKISDIAEWARIHREFSKFTADQRVQFYATGISNEKNATFVTFEDALQMVSKEEIAENSIFVKLDIEMSEFRVLPDVLPFQRYINSLVIEFHELDILWAQFAEITGKLKEYYEITHIHGNNYGGLIPKSGVPKVLEITFLKKALMDKPDQASEITAYPIPQLDYPNKRSEKDYPLVFDQSWFDQKRFAQG